MCDNMIPRSSLATWLTVQHIAGMLIPMPGNVVDTPILSIDHFYCLLYGQYETSEV